MLPESSILHMSPTEREQLIAYTRRLTSEEFSHEAGDTITSFQRQCPDTATKLKTFLESRLAQNPYVALLKGVPLTLSPNLQSSLSTLLGPLTTGVAFPGASMVYELRPATDATISGRPINEDLHTDGTATQHPNRYTILGCISPDQNGGGRSCLLDVDTVMDLCPRDLLRSLRDKQFPWLIRGEQNQFVIWDTILSSKPVRLRWMLHSIESGFAFLAGDRSCDLYAARAFDAYLRTTTPVANILLNTDDLLFVNNEKSLHSRTAVRDPVTSRRRLFRTKVA